MTILAPDTPYFEAWCSVHGIVHEGIDFDVMAVDLEYHSLVLKCPNTRFYNRIVPAVQDALVDALQGRRGTLESLPVPVASRSVRRRVAVLEAVPGGTMAIAKGQGERLLDGNPQAFGFRGRLTGTSWEPPKPDMPIEDWLAEVGLLWALRDRLQWCLGDAMLYGETRYGEMWSQVADQHNQHTLENCRWVASRFPISRRRDSLSFAHHAEVAKMELGEQDAWLDRAEAEAMPRAELRKALKGEVTEEETHACPLCGREHRKL